MNIAEILATEQRLIQIHGPDYKEKDIPPTLRKEIGMCCSCGKLTGDKIKIIESPKDEVGHYDWMCFSCKSFERE